MMREKMEMVRRRKEYHEKRAQVNIKLREGRKNRKTRNPQERTVVETWEVSGENNIQDKSELVIVGADVAALYPSLNDIEVAIIIFNAILNTDIKFLNFNYRVASVYIAMHLTPDEVRRSPLGRVLPKRSAKGGVRPGVSANPRNEENWVFPEEGMTEYEEKLTVALATQIGSSYDEYPPVFLQWEDLLTTGRWPDWVAVHLRCCPGGDEHLGCQVDGAHGRE